MRSGAGWIPGNLLLADVVGWEDTVNALIAAAVATLAANLGKRGRVRVATTANISIATALNPGDVLNGVTLVAGDLVLVKDQTTAAQNGIYVVAAVPVRASSYEAFNDYPGVLIAATEGTVNADTLWFCPSNQGGTLAAFADPINRLLDQIRSGRPDFDAFARQLNDIAQAQPSAGMSKTADEVLKLGERAMTAQTALSKMDAVTRVLAGTASAADYTLAGLGESLAKIREGATGGYLTLQNFLPGMTDFVGRQRDIQSATKTYQEAVTSLQQLYRMGEIGGREYSQQTAAYRSMYGQALDAINNRPSDAQKQAANEADQRAEIYTRSAAAIREQTRALDAERATMSMSQEAAQRYRTEQDLLSDAQRAGRPITASLTEEIGKLATAYAAAEMAMRAARLEQDLLFERAQLFRSPTEQRVASELRGAGIDAGSEQGRMLASTIRYNEALRESRDLALDFGSTFVSDLRNGASAMDALTNAAGRLGDRLIDMAMNQLINSLFANLMGAFGGSAFGGGNVAGYFGNSGYTNNLAYGGARAAGGVIRGPGTGTSDSIVARVSNGEFIVNAAATARHRPTLEQINRSPGFASGGMVGGSSSTGTAPIVINTRVRPQAGETAEVSAQRSANGDIDLEVVIRRIEVRVADGIVRNRGPISRALSARGASPSTRG